MSDGLDAEQIWVLYWDQNKTLAEISDVLDVSVSTLYREFKRLGFPSRKPGSESAGRKLTAAQVRLLRQHYADTGGLPDGAAERYGVSRQALNKAARGLTYRSI